MNVEPLKALGRQAASCRGDKAAYSKAIADIDAEVDALKRHYPAQFWDTQSPEYRKMSAQWAEERRARAEAVAA